MFRVQDMPGPSPAFKLLISINAPVALMRAFWFRYVPEFWDQTILVAGVGLLWLWVARNIQSWWEQRKAFNFSAKFLRTVTNLILVSTGILWGVESYKETFGGYLSLYQQGTMFFLRMAIQLAWCIALIHVFALDSVKTLFQKST